MLLTDGQEWARSFLHFYFKLRSNKDIHQDPVKGRRGAASLHVAQDGDPGVESQTAHDQLDTERRGKIVR